MSTDMATLLANMETFRRALADFNQRLRGSFMALEAQHDNVSPHWQDEMRLQYDSVWHSLEAAMKYYVTTSTAKARSTRTSSTGR